MMTIEEAQRQVRHSYVGGAPGVLVSGAVWLMAAIVEARSGTATGFAALFIGGMFIFPLSSLVTAIFFRGRGKAASNGLTGIALESTIAMIGGLLVAWLFLRLGAPELVFPAAAIAVGTHYFPFKTLYGDRTYWALAAAITLAGLAGIFIGDAMPLSTAFLVALIEAVFGIVLLVRAKPEA